MTMRPWTDADIEKARKMIAQGMSMRDVDDYFGRQHGSTSDALRRKRKREAKPSPPRKGQRR